MLTSTTTRTTTAISVEGNLVRPLSPPRSLHRSPLNRHQSPHRDDLHTASKEQRSRALVRCPATKCKTSIGSESKRGGGGVESGGRGKLSWTTRARSRLGSRDEEEEAGEEGEVLLMAEGSERQEWGESPVSEIDKERRKKMSSAPLQKREREDFDFFFTSSKREKGGR